MPTLGLTDEDIEEEAQPDERDVDEARDWPPTYMPSPWGELLTGALLLSATPDGFRPPPEIGDQIDLPDGSEIDPEDLSTDERQALRQRYRNARLRAAQAARDAADALEDGADAAFAYDQETKRWLRTNTGEALEDRTVRTALDEAVKNQSQAIRSLTQRLRDGDITLQQWQRTMMDELKDAHINAGALGSGGYDNLDSRAFGQIGGRLQDEYTYLRGFARAIDEGEQALDGTALRRAQLYVGKARQTHHEIHRYEMAQIGYNQERNVLGIAEHCEECVNLTSRGDDGWVPNGTLPPVGTRLCLGNCQCTIEYRRTDTTDPTKFPIVRR